MCFLGKPRDYSKNIWKNELIQKFDHKIRDRINICSALLRPGISISGTTMQSRTYNQYIDFVKYDTEQSLDWFMKNLNLTPTDYCFPFDDESEELKEILRSFGFKNFFGANRTTIEEIYAKKNNCNR